jgi:DNA-binding NtrC family response regulator
MKPMESRILVVDDEQLVRWSLTQALEAAGYHVEQACDAKEALEAARRETPDLVLLDYRLPDQTGLEVLRKLRKATPRLPVVMITAHASVGGAVEAMKEGAYDYVSKPFEIDDVIQTVARALEAGRLREEVTHRREEGLRDSGLKNMVVESAAMKELVHLIRRVAASEATTILLLGESGVGKGLAARALHFEGSSLKKPFMNITCTALTESLLESELFGHEKGAFTDAKSQKKGLFELADGGTIFLDEIGDLSPGLQGKLLRFLEDKSFRRVGGSREITVSVRIIAATNKDLTKEVEEGNFRRDLYYRLKVIPIEIPPLRQRAGDILPLAHCFIRHFNSEFRKAVQGIESSAEDRMKEYQWPGNVRELRNAIERAVLLMEGEWITADDLPVELRLPKPRGEIALPGSQGIQLPPEGVVLDELERDLLRQALARAQGNRTHAARLLGMNRDQIRYRIQKFHLEDATPEERPVHESD